MTAAEAITTILPVFHPLLRPAWKQREACTYEQRRKMAELSGNAMWEELWTGGELNYGAVALCALLVYTMA